MKRRVHALWWVVLAILGALAILSLWSDVWEAYVGLFVLVSVVYGVMVWKTR